MKLADHMSDDAKQELFDVMEGVRPYLRSASLQVEGEGDGEEDEEDEFDDDDEEDDTEGDDETEVGPGEEDR